MNSTRRLPSPSFRIIAIQRNLPRFAAFCLLAAGTGAFAQGTRLWTQSHFEEFEKGSPQGVEIASDGKLRTGPATTELLTTPSSFVWSVAADKNGTVYLATGSPASVLRVVKGADGKWQSSTLFETKAVAVQAVRLGLDGSLYAATLPDGKVYRLKKDATTPQDETTAEVILDLGKNAASDTAESEPKKPDATDAPATDAKPAETKPAETKPGDGKAHYIWDMTFDASGRLYVATGGPGAIYRLNVSEAKPTAELFFQSDEQHIRTLAWDKAGNLIAGTDGSGLVYRIDPAGKGYVLFSAPRREVTAVAVGADGSIYEADVGDKTRNPLPQLPVQNGNVGITISFVQPGSVQAANASTALPEGSEIYVLKPNEAPRRIWTDKDAIVYKLTSTSAGLTALTGNRGRIFTIRPDNSYSDVAHLEAQQAVAMTETPQGWLVGTANTGKLCLLAKPRSGDAAEKAEDHSYSSDVLDAGAVSRWGRVEVDPGSHSYQLWTRSGNVEQPVRSAKDWGWSDWQPAANDKVASPMGRYFQWKVVLGEGGEVGGVGVNFLPVNSAPVIEEVVVVPGARVTQQTQPPVQQATVMIAFPNAGANAGVVFDGGGNATSPIQAQKDRTAVTAR